VIASYSIRRVGFAQSIPLSVALLCAVVAARPAAGQDAPSPAGDGVPALGTASEPDPERAAEAFRLASEAFRAKRFDDAYDRAVDAYWAGYGPDALELVAVSALSRGLVPVAFQVYEILAADGNTPAGVRGRAERQLTALKNQAVPLTVVVEGAPAASTEVLFHGIGLGPVFRASPLFAMPGTHDIGVRSARGASESKSVRVVSKEPQTLTFDLVEASADTAVAAVSSEEMPPRVEPAAPVPVVPAPAAPAPVVPAVVAPAPSTPATAPPEPQPPPSPVASEAPVERAPVVEVPAPVSVTVEPTEADARGSSSFGGPQRDSSGAEAIGAVAIRTHGFVTGPVDGNGVSMAVYGGLPEVGVLLGLYAPETWMLAGVKVGHAWELTEFRVGGLGWTLLGPSAELALAVEPERAGFVLDTAVINLAAEVLGLRLDLGDCGWTLRGPRVDVWSMENDAISLGLALGGECRWMF
jgi:hypothetical protein